MTMLELLQQELAAVQTAQQRDRDELQQKIAVVQQQANTTPASPPKSLRPIWDNIYHCIENQPARSGMLELPLRNSFNCLSDSTE